MSGIKKESIRRLIDKKIDEGIKKGNDWYDIQLDLDNRMSRFVSSIKEEDTTIDIVKSLSLPYDEIMKFKSSRIKYRIIYIKEAFKRKTDIDWILNRKHKFKNLNDDKLIELIRLKDKLSKFN